MSKPRAPLNARGIRKYPGYPRWVRRKLTLAMAKLYLKEMGMPRRQLRTIWKYAMDEFPNPIVIGRVGR